MPPISYAPIYRTLVEWDLFAPWYRREVTDLLARLGYAPVFNEEFIRHSWRGCTILMRDDVSSDINPFTLERRTRPASFLCYNLVQQQRPPMIARRRGIVRQAPEQRALLAKYPLQYVAIFLCCSVYTEAMFHLDPEGTISPPDFRIKAFKVACQDIAKDASLALTFMRYFNREAAHSDKR
jgi:hypothetical protein